MAEPLTGRDRDLFVKCMGMTTSNQDGEALAALRKANAILARLKLSWAEVMAPAAAVPRYEAHRHDPNPARSGFEDVWGAGATRDFKQGFEDLAREARRNREKHRAEEQARSQAQQDQVRRASIDAAFDLLLKSDRLPPLKRDYFQQLLDRWTREGKLSMPEEEQLKRAYAVWG